MLSVTQYILYSDVNYYKQNIVYFNVAVVISRCMKITLDIYFHLKFLQIFLYLVRKSKEKGEISRFQNFIQSFIMFLYVVGLFHSLLVFYSVFEQLLDPNYTTSSFNRFYLFTGFTLIPIKDFFIALLFSYLYYYQGRKQ